MPSVPTKRNTFLMLTKDYSETAIKLCLLDLDLWYVPQFCKVNFNILHSQNFPQLFGGTAIFT